MRKTELLSLFGYTDYAWELFRDAIPESKLSETAENSGWPTLSRCLGHIVVAYDRWLPAIVELKAESLPKVHRGDFITWGELDAGRSRVRDPLRAHLDAWNDEELAEMHDVDVDGDLVRYTRGELIAHLLLHERVHHGDVTTLMWQLGIDNQLPLEYRFFLGRHDPSG